MRKYRVLTLVMALVMVMQCAITSGAALGVNRYPDAAETAGNWVTFSHVNPLYDDVITEEDLPEFEPDETASPMELEESALTTREDVKAALQNSLVNRKETVVVTIDAKALGFDLKVPQTSDQTDSDVVALNAAAEEVFYWAFDHNMKAPETGDYLRWSFGGYTGGAISSSADGGVTIAYLELLYYPEYFSTREQEDEVDAMVDYLVSGWRKMGLNGDNAYPTVNAIYNFICENVVYVEDDVLKDESNVHKYSAHAALIDGSAVCQGYSTLFYRLALEMGVDARLIAGKAYGTDENGAETDLGRHAWNIVKLGETYYYLDSTWDAVYRQAGAPYAFYLKTGEDFEFEHQPDSGFGTDFWDVYQIADTDYYTYATDDAMIADTDLSWTLDSGVLTVSGSGVIESAPWADYKDQIFKVVIGDGVTDIGEELFLRYPALHTVEIADSVLTVGNAAFGECPSLSAVNLGEGIKNLGCDAFTGAGVWEVNLPASLTGYAWSFARAPFLQRIGVAEENETFCEIDGVLFDRDGKGLLQYPIGRGDAEYEIPGTVTAIGSNAFAQSNLRSVVIPTTELGIMTWAFVECGALEEIRIPAAIDYISDNAFAYCGSLADAYFYGDWKDESKISEHMFEAPDEEGNYENEKEITIHYPENNETWVDCPWHDSETYLNYTLDTFDASLFAWGDIADANLHWELTPDGVLTFYVLNPESEEPAYIPNYGYDWEERPEWTQYHTRIQKAVVSDGISEVGSFAFVECEALQEVELPGSVWRIGDCAFSGCTSLGELTIPASVHEIGGAFCNGAGVEDFRVQEGNEHYMAVEGVLFTTWWELKHYPIGRTDESYELPLETVGIANAAFEYDGELKEVILNEGLTYIHHYAFSSTGITSVTIPKTVNDLCEGAFAYNNALKTVIFEGAMPSYMNAWLFCAPEEDQQLPDGFMIYANANMPGWTEAVTFEGEGEEKRTYLDLENNKRYPITLTAEEITEFASGELHNMTWCVTDEGVLEITLKEGAEDTWMPDFDWEGTNRAPWYGYSLYITSIHVGDGISNIGDRAFLDQFSAVSVRLPDSLERIGDAAFWSCEDLTSVTIPAGVYDICDNAFVANKSMTKYKVADGNEHYQSVDGVLCRDEGRFLMFYPVGKTKVDYTVPDGVVEINSCAYEYNHFTYVTIPAGVEHIYNDAFALSETLEQVIISTTVCDIGDRAFADCPNLTHAIFEGAAPIYVGWDAFGYMGQYNENFSIYCYPNAGWVVADNDMWNSIEDQYYPITVMTEYASNIAGGKFTYKENTFTWYISPDGTLVVSGNGALPDFVPEEEGGVGPAPWYDSRASVRQIEVGEGITLIGWETFTDMSGLTEAQLPNTLTTIKDNGFRSTSLPVLEIPASLTEIYSGAFGSIYNLSEIKVAEGNDAFMVVNGVLYSADRTRLFLYPAAREADKFEVPEGVVSIEAQAFQNARVPEIILPDTLEKIGWAAFCHGALKNITIPASVKHIEGDAFNWAWELSDVYFKGVVLRIEHNIFDSIADHVIIHYPVGNAIWENQLLKNEDGSILEDDEGYAYWLPNENNPEYRAVGVVVEGDSTGNLVEGTYENTEGEECTWFIDSNGVLHFTGSGSMPDWDELPEWYDYCEIVTGVEFGEELTSIGRFTLREFKGIKTITIPGNIKRIREEAITECNGLTELVLAEGIEVIEGGAINCPGAEIAVDIPASVTELGWRALGETLVTGYSVADGNEMYFTDECGAIYYHHPEDETCLVLHSYPIGNGRTEYAIKDGTNDIAAQAFCGASALTTITMPDTVRYIAWWAFSWCENLTEITLSADLTWMDNNVFAYCDQLTKVYFRSNPPENESFLDLFLGCADDLTVYYPAGSEAWKEFANCNETGAGAWVMDHEIYDEENDKWTVGTISVPVDDYAIEGNLAEGSFDVPHAWDEEGNVTDTHKITWYIDYARVLHITGEGSLAHYDWENPAPWYGSREDVDTIRIYDGITEIGSMNFVHFDAEVEIPESVTTICEGAFTDCGNLYTVNIPANTIYIYAGAFTGSNAEAFTVAEKNKYYFVHEGVLFERFSWYADELYEVTDEHFGDVIDGREVWIFPNQWMLTAYPNHSEVTEYALPANTVAVMDNAFAGAYHLTKITLNPGLMEIRAHAFSGIEGVTEITIPATVSVVGRNFIHSFDNLKKVTFEGDLPVIQDELGTIFESCPKSMEIYYPTGYSKWDEAINEDGKWYITYNDWDEEGAPEYKIGYTAISLPPATSGQIGAELYWEVTKDGTLLVQGSGTTLHYNSETCAPWAPLADKITAIHVDPSEDGEIVIGMCAFQGLGDVNEITLDEGVSKIFAYAFADVNLTEGGLTIPASADVLDAAFACAGINSFAVADNAAGLVTDEFGMALYSIETDENGEQTAKILVDMANNVAAYMLPDDLTAIGDCAFDRCTGLTSITIPKNVNYIGSSVFDGCMNLKQIIFKGDYNDNLIAEDQFASGLTDENGNQIRLEVYYNLYAAGWEDCIAKFEKHAMIGYVFAGDMNCDCEVNTTDLQFMLDYYAGKIDPNQSEYGIYTLAGDINGDGEVTRADAMMLNRYLAGWDPSEYEGFDTIRVPEA